MTCKATQTRACGHVPRTGGNDELIGALSAISVVSRRLAGKIAALEHRQETKPRGGKRYVTGQSPANRK